MQLPSFRTFVICGSIAYDHVMQYDGRFSRVFTQNIHEMSLAFLAKEKRVHVGGCGGNICYSLAQLGERPILVGVCGDDFSSYRAWLEKNGVDTRGVRVVRGRDTAAAYITTDRDENQLTLFYPGAPEVFVSLQKYKNMRPMVFIAPDAPRRVMHCVFECQKYKLPYVFDPGQNVSEFSLAFLRKAILGAVGVFANTFEWEILQKRIGFSAQELVRNVPLCVITAGPRGSTVWFHAKKHHIPAKKVRQVIDPTGCGDAYRAGFLKGWKEGFSAERCGRLGALLGSLVVQKAGTQKHCISWNTAKKKI